MPNHLVITWWVVTVCTLLPESLWSFLCLPGKGQSDSASRVGLLHCVQTTIECQKCMSKKENIWMQFCSAGENQLVGISDTTNCMEMRFSVCVTRGYFFLCGGFTVVLSLSLSLSHTKKNNLWHPGYAITSLSPYIIVWQMISTLVSRLILQAGHGLLLVESCLFGATCQLQEPRFVSKLILYWPLSLLCQTIFTKPVSCFSTSQWNLWLRIIIVMPALLFPWIWLFCCLSASPSSEQLRSDRGLTLKTSAFESLHGNQITCLVSW